MTVTEDDGSGESASGAPSCRKFIGPGISHAERRVRGRRVRGPGLPESTGGRCGRVGSQSFLQRFLVLLRVFCYSAEDVKLNSNFRKHFAILIAAAVVAVVCLLQALP